MKSWIAPVLTDKTKAFCKYCCVEIRAHYHDLKSHAGRSKHHSRSKRSAESISSYAIFVKPISDVQKRRELKIAAYAACNIPISTVDELGEILSDEFGSFDLDSTKCTTIITSLLGPYFKEQLLDDVGQSPYSLLVEQSTDISVKPLLGISIRYFSQRHNQFVCSYLGLIDLLKEDDVAKAILDLLDENKLQTENLVGLAADGASVICSKNHAVFISLMGKQPSLQLVSCDCHSLETIAKNAVQSLPSNLEFMIRETYKCLAESAKWQDDAKELYELLTGDPPLKLFSPTGTCWFVMADCVERILEQFDALKVHFSQAHYVEHQYASQLLQEMYDNENNFLYLSFLKQFLQEIKTVDKIFQMESGDAVEQFRDLHRLFLSTLERIVEPSILRSTREEELRSLDLQNPTIYRMPEGADLGIRFQQKLEASELPEVAKGEITKRCFDFIKLLLTQYQMRLVELLNVLEKLEFLSPKKALADKKPVIELPGIFFTCPTDVLESQWTNVSSCKFTEEESMERFWVEVFGYTDAAGKPCFLEMSLGAFRMLLTLPLSSTRLEKMFSCVPFFIEDSMEPKLLSNRMHIIYGLQRNNLNSASFTPDKALMERYPSSILDK